MFHGYIYIVLDQKHNLNYVGQKLGLPQKSEDYFGSGKIIQKILFRRGRLFLRKRILGIIESETLEELKVKLNEAETECIDFFRTYSASGLPPKDFIYGYNLTMEGNGQLGNYHTRTTKQLQSNIQKQRFKDINERQKHSQALRQYYDKNPQARLDISETQKKHHLEHPERGRQHSRKLKKYFQNPMAVEKNSQAQLKYYREHPEASQKIRDGVNLYYKEHPSYSEEQSQRMKIYYREHPEKVELHNQKIKKPVLQFNKKMNFLKIWNSALEASQELHIHHGDICQCCTGKIKSAGGFIWRH